MNNKTSFAFKYITVSVQYNKFPVELHYEMFTVIGTTSLHYTTTDKHSYKLHMFS